MKVEGYVFAFFATFLGGTTIVYWLTSKEVTGTTALAISVGLGVLIGTYLLFTARRVGPRPQDLPEGEVIDGAGDIAIFSPWSYWPIGIAAGTVVMVMGLIFGIWLALIGVLFVTVFTIGLSLELVYKHYDTADFPFTESSASHH